MVTPIRYWTGTSQVFLRPNEATYSESTEKEFDERYQDMMMNLPRGAHNNLTEKGQNAKLNSPCCL